jgi:hypothetical protein
MKNLQKLLYIVFLSLSLIQASSCAAAGSSQKLKSGFNETKVGVLPNTFLGILPFGQDFVMATLNKDQKQCLIIDGKEGPGFDAISPDTISYNSNSKRYVYVAKKDDQLVVVNDGKPDQGYSGIGDGTLVVSADGKRIAYAAQKGIQWMIVIDGKADPEYDSIGPIASI